MKRNRTGKGFTLMEMLIVVAIIAVLVAIAIPVVSTSLSRARETTCTANRRSALALVTYTAMMDDAFRADLTNGMTWDAVNARLAQTEQPAFTEHICPDNGTVKLIVQENGAYSFSCSVHTETAPTIEAWTPTVGKVYEIGDRCAYQGKIYECINRHTYNGDANWAPNIAHSLWKDIT